MTLPLEGYRMLDISRLVPGPMTTWMLADLGMDVLKIEDMEVARAGRARDSFSPKVDDPHVEARAIAWNHVGRNKRSISINLQNLEGQKILHKLAENADVFFGSFRLPVYKRLGADYETLSRINPRLVYATLSGYGFGNRFTDYPGNERNSQGMSGVSAMTTGQDGEPADFLFLPVDSFGAAMAVISIQAALMARDRTGKGQQVDIALTECGSTFLNSQAPGYFREKQVRKRGSPSLGNLRCKDGKYLSSAASAQTHFWKQFCDVIGRPQYAGVFPGSDRYDGDVEGVIRDVRQVMMTKTRDEWLQLLPTEIAVTPLLEFDEVMEGAYLKERNAVWELDHPLEGKVRQIGSPFHLSDTPPQFRNFAPMLGENTVEVLQSIGYSEGDIQRLEREGVVRTAHV